MNDGRGESLPPAGLLARVWAWLKARPAGVFIGLLIVGGGIQTARIGWRDKRADAAKKKADLLRLKNARETARARDAAAAERRTSLEQEIEAAEQDASAGVGQSLEAHDRLKRLERGPKGRRWPTE